MSQLFCAESWNPVFLIFSSEAPILLYYSHIPAALLILVLAGFVLLNQRNLVSFSLVRVALIFNLWVFINLIAWVSDLLDLLMFVWSLFGVVFVSISLAVVDFAYKYYLKEPPSGYVKTAFFLLTLIAIVITPTSGNIGGLDAALCNPGNFENIYFVLYYSLVGFLSILYILYLSIKEYLNRPRGERRQVLVFASGVELFLLAFYATTLLASYLSDIGVSDDFQLEFYGVFAMPVFMSLLVYLIVQYKAFNIRLLGAQALVLGVIILVGSQFIFIRNPINQVLNGITFILVTSFGFFLVRGVKREVQQRERLEVLTTELQKTTKSLATTNSKLESANKELERLDQAKSEFLSIASHQLRTPLTVIKGYTSMLQEGSFGKVPVKIGEVLDKVFISTERLISLVESLLNISRIEAGRIQFDMQPVDLTKTISELVTDFQQKAAAKKLVLEFTPEKNVPAASADPQKVKEIISNLLDNAIKYTEKGSINVGLHQESQSIVFTSQDTGLGIEPEDLPRLFNKFVRGKGMQQVHTEGTGLGLYFARMVVEQMGGRIWAESEGKGKGSKFSFSLPMADKSKVVKIK